MKQKYFIDQNLNSLQNTCFQENFILSKFIFLFLVSSHYPTHLLWFPLTDARVKKFVIFYSIKWTNKYRFCLIQKMTQYWLYVKTNLKFLVLEQIFMTWERVATKIVTWLITETPLEVFVLLAINWRVEKSMFYIFQVFLFFYVIITNLQIFILDIYTFQF